MCLETLAEHEINVDSAKIEYIKRNPIEMTITAVYSGCFDADTSEPIEELSVTFPWSIISPALATVEVSVNGEQEEIPLPEDRIVYLLNIIQVYLGWWR